MVTNVEPANDSGLPTPHRCPWWVQYLLVSPLRRLREPPHKLVGDLVRPGMTVLDPGCGFGFLTLPLARMVGPEGKVIAVDIEPRAIEKLKRRAHKARVLDRIDTRFCTATDLGLTELTGQVDLVTAIHTLHEFEDLSGFLMQVWRVLNSDGHMLVVEPARHVTRENFEAEVQCCLDAGFTAMPISNESGKRHMALFRK